MSEAAAPAPCDWDRVRDHLLASCARNAADHRSSVVVLAVDRLAQPWEIDIAFVDRRDGSRHRQRFDLVSCWTAYDATSVDQLAGMVHADLEESVLSVPPSRRDR
ncbi:MAG: hypothetical protein ACRYG2_38215, partial [Janthinobacterium lividum]